jgi:hypothetical protein
MSKMFKGSNNKDIAKIRNSARLALKAMMIYTLAIANMIVRGDSKSNIIFGIVLTWI